MLDIVKKHKPRYKTVTEKGKESDIVIAVTKEIESQGARFLKRAKGGTGWLELSADEKHKKVFDCLRDASNNVPPDAAGSNSSVASLPGSKGGESQGAESDRASRPESVASSASGAQDRERSRKDKKRKRKTQGTSKYAESGQFESADDERKVAAAIRIDEKNHHFRLPTSTAVSETSNCTPVAQLPSDRRSGSYRRRAKDSSESSESDQEENAASVIRDPLPQDVLIGYEPEFPSRRGNTILRRLIRGSVGYPPLPAQGKWVLAQGIIEEMKSQGARFLTRASPTLWNRLRDVESELLVFRLLEEEESRTLSAILQMQNLPPATIAGMNVGVYPGGMQLPMLHGGSGLPVSSEPQSVAALPPGAALDVGARFAPSPQFAAGASQSLRGLHPSPTDVQLAEQAQNRSATGTSTEGLSRGTPPAPGGPALKK